MLLPIHDKIHPSVRENIVRVLLLFNVVRKYRHRTSYRDCNAVSVVSYQRYRKQCHDLMDMIHLGVAVARLAA